MKSIFFALMAYVIIMPATRADDPSTPERNIALIRAHLDMMNRGDWHDALEFFAVDTRNFGKPVGRVVMARIFEDVYTTFPDWHMTIVEITAAGDSVIARVLTSGTHEGVGKIPINGGMLVGVAPTHRHFEAQAIHWYKLAGGKIIDHYATRDDLAMMQQLGFLPRPAPFDWQKLASGARESVSKTSK